jgi:hypothetical protein
MMRSRLRLTEDELGAIETAAAPLPPANRAAFVSAVTEILGRCEVIGAGVVHRICRELQPRFLPPDVLPKHPTGVVTAAGTPCDQRLKSNVVCR